jgi:hypothetical protein
MNYQVQANQTLEHNFQFEMKNMIHVNPYVKNLNVSYSVLFLEKHCILPYEKHMLFMCIHMKNMCLRHMLNILGTFLGETLYPTIWKTYVIYVYPYEKHVSAPYVKHMGYFSWRNHMFLPYVKHVCHIRLKCGAFLPVSNYIIAKNYMNYYKSDEK